MPVIYDIIKTSPGADPQTSYRILLLAAVTGLRRNFSKVIINQSADPIERKNSANTFLGCTMKWFSAEAIVSKSEIIADN